MCLFHQNGKNGIIPKIRYIPKRCLSPTRDASLGRSLYKPEGTSKRVPDHQTTVSEEFSYVLFSKDMLDNDTPFNTILKEPFHHQNVPLSIKIKVPRYNMKGSRLDYPTGIRK